MGVLSFALSAAAGAGGAAVSTLLCFRALRRAVVDAAREAADEARDQAFEDMALSSYYAGGPRPHRKNADDLMLGSGRALANELKGCYEGISEVGRGVVYFGSARLQPGSPLYEEGRALARRLHAMLKVPAWSGGGKGMMGAVTLGAREGGCPVGAVRISREASDVPGKAPPGQNPLHATSVFCQFMASRKIGLTDAGMRVAESDRTAFVGLPGGIGTVDELIEILVLGQLNKLGTNYPVPVLLMNYEVAGSPRRYYDGLVGWLDDCCAAGALAAKELAALKVCASNDEAVAYLQEFYKIEGGKF